MISSVAVRAHGREGGREGSTRLGGRRVIKSRYPRKRQKETEQLRCCGRGEYSRQPLQPNRKTLRSCYTFAEESSCAFPNTRCDAQAPAQIFLLGKQASLAADADAAPLKEEEEGSIHFTLYVSHRIATRRQRRRRRKTEGGEGRVRNF